MLFLSGLSFHTVFTRSWAAEWGFKISAEFFLTVLTPCGNVTTVLRSTRRHVVCFLCFPVQSVRAHPIFCSIYLGQNWFVSSNNKATELSYWTWAWHSCDKWMFIWLYSVRGGCEPWKTISTNASYKYKSTSSLDNSRILVVTVSLITVTTKILFQAAWLWPRQYFA